MSQNKTKSKGDRPAFVIRIFEEIRYDSRGRAYREGVGWNYSKKESNKPDEAGEQA